MGSRAAVRGRRRVPDAERALYFGKLRDAVSNTDTKHNTNTNAYWDSKHDT
jgi:hypothetical protein